MCKDIADKLLSFHLQSRCDICKTQAAESKQVWATVQPPYAPCFTHTCSCNPPQNPYPVGAALFHKGGQGRSEVRPLAQGHYQEVTRPTFRFMSVEFFPPHSIGQTAGTLDLTSHSADGEFWDLFLHQEQEKILGKVIFFGEETTVCSNNKLPFPILFKCVLKGLKKEAGFFKGNLW